MKKLIATCLSAALVCVLTVSLTGCDGWKALTSAGINMEDVELDDRGYIKEEDVKDAVLESEMLAEAECFALSIDLHEETDPVVYMMDFSSAANTYHFEVNAKTGELVDKLVYSL